MIFVCFSGDILVFSLTKRPGLEGFLLAASRLLKQMRAFDPFPLLGLMCVWKAWTFNAGPDRFMFRNLPNVVFRWWFVDLYGVCGYPWASSQFSPWGNHWPFCPVYFILFPFFQSSTRADVIEDQQYLCIITSSCYTRAGPKIKRRWWSLSNP